MVTDYQMWMTYNAEAQKLRIPVLPEKFSISLGSKNSSVDVVGLGEVVVKQARPAFQFTFESFFPAASFPGLSISEWAAPLEYVEKLKEWCDGDKPVHLILTDVGVDMFCTIERFSYYEQGGDVGTIHYSLTLKEYREVTVRQVMVADGEASVQKGETRIDNSTIPSTYTVKSGDCLFNIAKKYYGDGAKWTMIYNANQSVIGSNPNLIYPGQVLSIPAV